MSSEREIQNANMRWTLPIEHLSIATLFIVVGLLINALQFVVFIVFWPINHSIYRRLVNVSFFLHFLKIEV